MASKKTLSDIIVKKPIARIDVDESGLKELNFCRRKALQYNGRVYSSVKAIVPVFKQEYATTSSTKSDNPFRKAD